MNEPQMAALLVAHGRPGFYLRVLEEGQVEAGDEIVQVGVGPVAGQPFWVCGRDNLPNGHSPPVQTSQCDATKVGFGSLSRH
jgi:hypothetical protein